MDDDDSYLYGDSNAEEPAKPAVQTSVPQPISVEQSRSVTQGLVAKLEEQAADAANEDEVEEPELAEDGGEEDEEEDESEDDVEIIMEEPQSRSLDFRHQRQAGGRSTSATFSTPQRAPQPPQPSLTTEYTLRERGGITKLLSTPQPSQISQSPLPSVTTTPITHEKPAEGEKEAAKDTGPDPNTLPPVTAPPSHPSINPSIPGTLDGRSILEVDLNALAEKPWRRPGSDVSDWFNYGFDEISWEAYCYRRRELGDLAGMLKNNVMNFSGMSEDQLIALPPDVRGMVMAGATAVMASGGGGGPGGGGMMPPGAGMNMNGGPMMNQMMNIPMMNQMMEMGVGMGDMGMMPDGGQGGGAGPQGGGQGTSDGQVGMGMGVGVGEGFGPGGGPAGQGMMGMGMTTEFGMQDPTGMGQQMYPGMEGSGTPGPVATPPSRGIPQGQFRGGRGMPQSMAMRARGTSFAGRGRGIPVRPASPLPPNVPTGPRNKNKYKDIDGSAPAVDGLDYGGGGGGERDRSERSERSERSDRRDRATPDLDERDRTSRKRRASPVDREDSRSSKRR